jgi:hypothetical protein
MLSQLACLVLGSVSAEVVHDDADTLGVGEMNVDEVTHALGEVERARA